MTNRAHRRPLGAGKGRQRAGAQFNRALSPPARGSNLNLAARVGPAAGGGRRAGGRTAPAQTNAPHGQRAALRRPLSPRAASLAEGARPAGALTG